MTKPVFLDMQKDKVEELLKQFKALNKKFLPKTPDSKTANSEICRAMDMILKAWDKSKLQIFFDSENTLAPAAQFLKQQVSEKIYNLFEGYEANVRNSEARYQMFLNTLLYHIVNHLEASAVSPVQVVKTQKEPEDWDLEALARNWQIA